MSKFLTKPHEDKFVLVGSIGDQEFNVHVHNSDVAYPGTPRERVVDAMVTTLRAQMLDAIEKHFAARLPPA